MASQRPVELADAHPRLAWRIAATVALLLVLGSATGVGIGYLLVKGIRLLLSGAV